jgi:hypothetical protein
LSCCLIKRRRCKTAFSVSVVKKVLEFKSSKGRFYQGCQMVYFQTKNPNLAKFCRALDGKILLYFMDIWNISRTFGIFHGHLEYFTDIWNISRTFGIFHGHLEYFYDHLVHFVFIWYIFPAFMHDEKSGNPGFYQLSRKIRGVLCYNLLLKSRVARFLCIIFGIMYQNGGKYTK